MIYDFNFAVFLIVVTMLGLILVIIFESIGYLKDRKYKSRFGPFRLVRIALLSVALFLYILAVHNRGMHQVFYPVAYIVFIAYTLTRGVYEYVARP